MNLNQNNLFSSLKEYIIPQKEYRLANPEEHRKIAVQRVNRILGLNSSNLSIAQGRIFTKEAQDAQREQIINIPDSFYKK